MFAEILFCISLIIRSRADGFDFNNPDGLLVSVVDQDGTKIYSSSAVRDNVEWIPGAEYVIVAARRGDKDVFHKQFRTSWKGLDRNRPYCNYALFVSEYNGYAHYKSSLSSTPCENDVNTLSSGHALVVFDNESDHVFHPSFAKNGGEFTADDILGWLEPGSIRVYSADDVYFTFADIHEGIVLSPAVSDPYIPGFITCTDFKVFVGQVILKYGKGNRDYKCVEVTTRDGAECSNGGYEVRERYAAPQGMTCDSQVQSRECQGNVWSEFTPNTYTYETCEVVENANKWMAVGNGMCQFERLKWGPGMEYATENESDCKADCESLTGCVGISYSSSYDIDCYLHAESKAVADTWSCHGKSGCRIKAYLSYCLSNCVPIGTDHNGDYWCHKLSREATDISQIEMWTLSNPGRRCEDNDHWTGKAETLEVCQERCFHSKYMTYVFGGDKNCACQDDCNLRTRTYDGVLNTYTNQYSTEQNVGTNLKVQNQRLRKANTALLNLLTEIKQD